MAHYAFMDEVEPGIYKVTEVIPGRNENEVVDGISDWEEYYGNLRGQVCKRTSYNGNYRKNFAGIGFTYDESRDAFIAPKNFESWVLNEDTCIWEAPVPYPTDGGMYQWDETNTTWIERTV